MQTEREIRTIRLSYRPAPMTWRERLAWLAILGLMIATLWV